MRVIKLSEDLFQEEPLGYLVFQDYEYQIFYDRREAEDFAEDSKVYPLYAGEPCTSRFGERSPK